MFKKKPEKIMKKIRETVFTIEILSEEPLQFDEIFSWKISKTSKLLKSYFDTSDAI